MSPHDLRIISGGQTGADRTALEVAFELGFETGGWAPKGYRTEDGSDVELKTKFLLLEHQSAQYRDRTHANVTMSDLTVWFGTLGTPGHRCTKEACHLNGKPILENPDGLTLSRTLRKLHVRVLNVAGNRASSNPYIGSQTREVLTAALQLYLAAGTPGPKRTLEFREQEQRKAPVDPNRDS